MGQHMAITVVKEYRSRSVVVLTPFLWFLDSDHAECLLKNAVFLRLTRNTVGLLALRLPFV